MPTRTYHGSCHCKAVTYEADIDFAKGSTRCNCSYCAKARAWFIFTPATQVRILTGAETLSHYAWTPEGRPAAHLHYDFCPRCGIRLWARGEMEALGGKFNAIHIPTLDDAMADILKSPIRYVDGKHDAFAHAPEDIVHL